MDVFTETSKATSITISTASSMADIVINTRDIKVMGSCCANSNIIHYMVDIVLVVNIDHKNRVDPTTIRVKRKL